MKLEIGDRVVYHGKKAWVMETGIHNEYSRDEYCKIYFGEDLADHIKRAYELYAHPDEAIVYESSLTRPLALNPHIDPHNGGCDYCNYELTNATIDAGEDCEEAEIKDGYLLTWYDGGCGKIYVKIDYCPKCGRKLKAEDKA